MLTHEIEPQAEQRLHRAQQRMQRVGGAALVMPGKRMVITRSNDCKALRWRRLWAKRSAPRATRTKATMLKAPRPAHSASVVNTEPRSEIASITRRT